MEMIADWITPGVVVAATGFILRYLRIIEKRLDRLEKRMDRLEERLYRLEERLDALSREVAANGRAIARLVGLHEVHPEHRPMAVVE